jgi:hypothetical protein
MPDTITTVDTTLRQLVHDLVVDPTYLMIQRTGERVLISDRYTIWNLAALGMVTDDDGDRVPVLLDTLPEDGTYRWKRDEQPSWWSWPTPITVDTYWRQVTDVRDAQAPQPVEWTGWSYNGVGVGFLDKRPVGAPAGWVRRMEEWYSDYQIVGYAPDQPLHILNEQEPRQVVGVVAHRTIPDLARLAPVLDVLLCLPDPR